MSEFAIYSADAGKIQKLLSAFQSTVGAKYLLLCHRDGSAIADVGDCGADNATLSVLTVANFSSAAQMGFMVGETTGFRGVTYAGSARVIHIAPVEDSVLLVEVFETGKLPARLDEYNQLLVARLTTTVPAFMSGTARIPLRS